MNRHLDRDDNQYVLVESFDVMLYYIKIVSDDYQNIFSFLYFMAPTSIFRGIKIKKKKIVPSYGQNMPIWQLFGKISPRFWAVEQLIHFQRGKIYTEDRQVTDRQPEVRNKHF